VRLEAAIAQVSSGLESLVGFQRQRANRNRAFCNAQISYVDGAISIKCVVNQVSESGAQLQIEDSVVLPEKFLIKIPQKRIDAQARLIWRKNNRAGIALVFDKEVEYASKEEYETARLEFLIAENVQLKAQLGVLVAQVNRLRDE
jgi:hypothetical protein